MTKSDKENDAPGFSRRGFMASSAVAAASAPMALSTSAQAMEQRGGRVFRGGSGKTAPFDSIRDMIDVMDSYGLVATFKNVDQDAYEATSIMYALEDTYGLYEMPLVKFENIKVDGEWIKGPLVANIQTHHIQETLLWGLEPDLDDYQNNYRLARKHWEQLFTENDGSVPLIDPVTVARGDALCKEVTLEGDDIDITKMAFIQGNPGDAGRYINTGSTFTKDPEWGQNFGTYRCQIIGPKQVILNSEPRQTANRMIARARERGETSMPMAIVFGQDPVTWMISGTRIPNPFTKAPPDELEVVGGLRGNPLEVVACDTNDMIIPAHCELVLEGELDLTTPFEEGPYHESYGYMGNRNDGRFVFHIKRVTHRKNPILVNSFTSIGGGFVKAPMDVQRDMGWQKKYPQIIECFYHDNAKGVYFVRIKKDRPGIGLEIAKYVAQYLICKVAVVVDEDLDPMRIDEMWLALGSRWQPDPASEIYKSLRASFFEPSSPDGKTSSKIAIDATMQWPEEGGPKVFPSLNRNLYEAAAPTGVADVRKKWPELLTRGPF